jgi:hypothetical protein
VILAGHRSNDETNEGPLPNSGGALRFDRMPLPAMGRGEVLRLHCDQPARLPNARKPRANKEQGKDEAKEELAAGPHDVLVVPGKVEAESIDALLLRQERTSKWLVRVALLATLSAIVRPISSVEQ